MTSSFRKIDYRLRPAKHAERIMLCEIWRRLRFHPIEDYQYVGFGSVTFVDFKMVHKFLGIKDMTSIEDSKIESENTRFDHNKPYEGMKLEIGNSKVVLPKLDFKKPSIVWLDYDDTIARSMATDLGIVAKDLPSGSFIGVTFTGSYPPLEPEASKELARLKSQFPEFVADDATSQQFTGGKIAEFGRAVLGQLIEKALNDADSGKSISAQRTAHQVCYFKYRDGAPMITIGWLIVADADVAVYESCKLSALSFVSTGNTPFKIKIPLVTPHEIRELERRLPEVPIEHDLDWIPAVERNAFYSIYRYLPHFGVIEPV